MPSSAPSRRYSPWLWLLTGFFALRVAAQPAALLVDHRLLPRFEAWHSGTIPYEALVLCQMGILVGMATVSRRFARGLVRPRRTLGLAVYALGLVYGVAMVLRVILGVTILPHSRWFSSWLPTLFHLVLASFLLLVSHYHRRAPATASAVADR